MTETNMRTTIHVGHSPDPDDAFMFYALAKDKIDTGDLDFHHTLQDIETLNRRALQGELELTAISVHGYAYVSNHYALLPCGASMGDQYGPMVVSTSPCSIEDLSGKKIAIPGTMTSAFLTLRLAIGEFEYEVVPFDEIIEAVESGRVDAGLIIHEGQLTYGDRGLHLVVDLGKWWFAETELPLPLGVNAVRKDLGEQRNKAVCRLMKESIQFSLDHREEALEYALQYGRDLDRGRADQFVGMYVNDWTLDLGDRGRRAIELLLQKGVESGLLDTPVDIEFIEY
ncbi:MAG: ABC transporter substrate-binding protein [Planctomycetes bacterium]|jgi:1,4-dihydroxy-6-naphthoate synthase|nr:ABC transporter substrate-binding protein [Planctomycetota bacterium]